MARSPLDGRERPIDGRYGSVASERMFPRAVLSSDAARRIVGSMQPLLVAILLIVAVLVRPVAIRLWRAGLISRRTALIVVFGRFPALVFTYGVVTGAAPLLILALSALAVVPTLILRGPLMDALGTGSPPTTRPGP
jgi:hypothetical protein